MGGAIRMIRDRAAGEELCRELGVTVVTRPEAESPVKDNFDIIDGRDDSMDQALLGKAIAQLRCQRSTGPYSLILQQSHEKNTTDIANEFPV